MPSRSILLSLAMLYLKLIILGVLSFKVSAFFFPLTKPDLLKKSFSVKEKKYEVQDSLEKDLTNSLIAKASLIFPITSILTLNTIDISATLDDFQNRKCPSSHSVSHHYIVNAAKDKSKNDASGTKMDPEYEKCLSKCLYVCTKPKGSETKLRADCLPECKEKCAPSEKKVKDKMEMSGNAY